MEQNFQTSFIPKKPMMVETKMASASSVSFLAVISLFIFFTVVVASGALYFYKLHLKSSITQMEQSLNLAKNSFEPSKITELQTLDRRLRAATDIVSHHVAVSPIFEALSAITLKTVRYTKFSYTLSNAKDGKVEIKMAGQAVGYRSIALQADLFTKNKNLIDPVFSNLTLDDKGNVMFDLDFSVDPSFVSYKQTVIAERAASAN